MCDAWIGDLEADGLLDTATTVWCGVFKNFHTKELRSFYPKSNGDTSYIRELLSFLDTVDELVMHNGIGYDWPLLKKLYDYDFKGRKIDTLIISRLLNPKRISPPHCPNKIAPHSVEAWGYRVGRGKPEHNDWSQFSKEMLHRCTEDVHIQTAIYEALRKEAKGYNWRNAVPMTLSLFELLHKQQEYGWKVDRNHMDRCIYFLQHWMDRIDKALDKHLPLILEINESKVKGVYKYVSKPFLRSGEYSRSVVNWLAGSDFLYPADVGGPFSRISFRKIRLDSNLESKKFLLDLGWIPDQWNYDKEGNKTSPKLSKDDPFEGVQGSVGRLMAKRVQCKQRMGIVAGLTDAIRPDGRISSVVSGLAATGRATHKTIVNIPGEDAFFGKWMRQIFVADEGKILVGTDSAACQMRMLCARMKDNDYTQAVLHGRKEDGTDPHSVNQRLASLPTRHSAKPFFYGVVFGAGDTKTGRLIGGTAADGKAAKERLFKGLPALERTIKVLTEEWQSHATRHYNRVFNRFEYKDGWFTGLDGRPIFVPLEHQVLVYALQSDEAIMMTAALLKAVKELDNRGYTFGKEYGLVNWYHDEFTFECDPDIAHIVAKVSEDAIAWAGEYFAIDCPHEGNAAIGKDWWEIH